MGIGTCVTPINAAIETADTCSTEVLLSYFPDQFVANTLEAYKVPVAQRAEIQRQLSEKGHEVIARVEEKAAKMSPNPLRDPLHRQEAVKIFRDTLFELFASVMNAHGINNNQEIQAMLDDLQQQKAKYFARCMEKLPAGSGVPSTTAPASAPTTMKQSISRQPRGPNADYSHPW
jgi:hypothetical protein